MMKFLSSILSILMIASMLACNSQPDKSKESKVDPDEVELHKDQVEEEDKNEHEPLQEAILYQQLDSDNLIRFNDLDWIEAPATDSSLIFNGINEIILAYAIINYAHENHIDPQREEIDPKDSVIIDLSEQSFTYWRISLSHLTEYDLRIMNIEFMNRFPWEEEDNMSDEEIETWHKEHQKLLDNVDSTLIEIKRYNRFVLKGNWSSSKFCNDTLLLNLRYYSRHVDPSEYYRYGENLQWNTDETDDSYSFDMLESFYEVGRLKMFAKSDLNIVNVQHLPIIRNQFYARKGYIFKTQKMQQFFDRKIWYEGVDDDVTNQLNNNEVYNVHLIKDIEDQLK
jgi:hypothetical protein